MASEDKAPLFNILENLSNSHGVAPAKVAEGDAAAGKNALAALSFKDTAGNLVYPKTNLSRELVISTEGAEVASLSDYAKIDGNLALTDVAVITLAASTVYKEIGWIVACYRDAEFLIVHNNNGVDVELGSILVGDSNHNSAGQLENLTFTSGATGTQELKIQAKNRSATSDLRATLSVKEIQ